MAVSGGVDSMALLGLLQSHGGYELIVAHLDHGIRSDSEEDRRLIEAVANMLGLPFFYREAKLGDGTSEAEARRVRYGFLNQIKDEQAAAAIITAHHQDDVLETAIINILRGTGRKGLTSLSSNEIVRPLLNVPKRKLIKYAKSHKLSWREDSTNFDNSYLRNYVRHNIVPRFDEASRDRFMELIYKTKVTNEELDDLLAKYLENSSVTMLNRPELVKLSHDLALEVMAGWLRLNNIRAFDRKTLERLVVAVKTGKPGQTFPVMSGYNIKVTRDELALTR